MSSKLAIDVEIIKKNCLHYTNLHSKSIDVLRKANGRDDYKKIAKILKLHPTKVSGLLKQAEKLGLATKEGKLYKKASGILQYMPKSNTKTVKIKNVSDIISKTGKRKIKFSDSNHSTYFSVNFQDNSEKMAKAYLWLYVTENTLRELIRKVFENEQDWWNKRVNDGIKKDVKDAKDKYPYHGAQRKDELEYTHLGQLKEIIMTKKKLELILAISK